MVGGDVTFVGLRVRGAVARALHETGRALAREAPALRVPALEDLHITLHDLGPTAAQDLAPLGEALAEASLGTPPLDLCFEGLGAFPRIRRPRVIWAGVQVAPDRLASLAEAVGRSATRPNNARFGPM